MRALDPTNGQPQQVALAHSRVAREAATVPVPDLRAAAAPQPERAGWRVGEWVKAVGISRSGMYALKPAIYPRSVLVGARRIITEAPAAWLARVGR